MRLDFNIIIDLIPNNSKIIDLGCGDGELLYQLKSIRNTEGFGIEINSERVKQAINKGISVIQGDIEDLISHYEDKSFDYCILSQTLQELHNPDYILSEILRISKNSIVAFYNLAHYSYRFQILFRGHFPKSSNLPYNWLTTNISFLSVVDFRKFCKIHDITIIKELFTDKNKYIKILPNWRSRTCVFMIQK